MKLISIFFSVIFVLGLFSCKSKSVSKSPRIAEKQLQKSESGTTLPITGNIKYFSYLANGDTEFFSFESNGKIFLVDLAAKRILDSISLFSVPGLLEKYGSVNSYCFSGKDSVFVELDNAIIFYNKKQLSKIIPINHQDSLQYPNFRFNNIEDAPIYFDKAKQEIVGEVYCSECEQSDTSFYKQKIIAGISLLSNKLTLYNVTYPKSYIDNYYGFGNHVYTDYTDSIVLISFPFESDVYALNRYSGSLTSYPARSRYQKSEVSALSVEFKNTTGEKMKHLVINPYYCEIRNDAKRNLIYRFLKTEVLLKKKNGKYNSFMDKKTVLTIFNSQMQQCGEFELSSKYSHYISFVGKKGLYMFSGLLSSPGKKNDSATFKILTFQ